MGEWDLMGCITSNLNNNLMCGPQFLSVGSNPIKNASEIIYGKYHQLNGLD
jgi:hypothetical protein